jgi:peroxidase
MWRSYGRLAWFGLMMTGLIIHSASSAAEFPAEFRTIDGSGNNIQHPTWGSTGIPLLRLVAPDYDAPAGRGTPAGSNRASARAISNACAAQSGSVPNLAWGSDFVWQWGQFIDHDIDLTGPGEPFVPFDIPVPTGDPFFDPFSTGTQVIACDRSIAVKIRGRYQQLNEITAYIDASQVYGSDPDRAQALRTLDGTGTLKTSAGNLLPFNVDGLPNAPDPDAAYFLAGDVRANEQVGLTAMHVLFVREHNYWADVLRVLDATLSGDEIYLRARAIVAAEIQAITYREFLPVLLGPNALTPYTGYQPEINAGIANLFSTAAYRFGHSMLSPTLLRLKANGKPISAGNLPLAEAFFNPHAIIAHGGIEPILRGLATQVAQEIDNRLVGGVRNFLFGPPGAGGFDLAALNIQRGRDHGLPSYNQVRLDLGLEPVSDFADISSDEAVQAGLASVYPTVDDIDVWVGGLAEDHVPGALVGETFFTVIKDQFERLRDGDRFWYQTYLPQVWAAVVEAQTLASIIRRNTTIGAELQDDVFLAPLPDLR